MQFQTCNDETEDNKLKKNKFGMFLINRFEHGKLTI